MKKPRRQALLRGLTIGVLSSSLTTGCDYKPTPSAQAQTQREMLRELGTMVNLKTEGTK